MQLTAFDNAIAEWWVKSARTECLDHLFVFGEAHLRRALAPASITLPTCALRFGSASISVSRRHLCSAGYIIFIALLHDKFLRPYNPTSSSLVLLRSFFQGGLRNNSRTQKRRAL